MSGGTKMSGKTKPRSRAGWGAAMAFSVLAAGAAADDRDILLEGAGSPYLFVVLDTSTSVTSTPPCTREQALDDMDPFDAMCTTVCPLEDSQCEQICPDLGCEEYDFTVVAKPDLTTPDIIRDNGGPGTSDAGWFATTVDATAYGGNYLEDNNTNLCGDPSVFNSYTECAVATYDPSPDLAAKGDYMIFVWWPDEGVRSFSTNTEVVIEHNDPDVPGSSTTSSVTVNQKLEAGSWNAIGTFEIEPGVSSGVVTIRNENANGVAVADAVGWLEVDIAPCLGEEVYRCQQPICNQGDCFTSFNGDDPRSKIFQAKEALYEVIADVSNIQYGFATFEQDELRLKWKHWMYRVADQIGLPTLGGTDFLTGAEEVFGNGNGDGWTCASGGGSFNDGRTGCVAALGADTTNPWDVRRARRIPKLGREGTSSTTVYYRTSPVDLFKVDYSPNGGAQTLGSSQIMVDIEVTDCIAPNGCLITDPVVSSGTVTYDLVSDYVATDRTARREPMVQGGFFSGQTNLEGDVSSPDPLLPFKNVSCLGLDGNDDAEVLDSACDHATDFYCDPFEPGGMLDDYNLRWDTDTTDTRGSRFYVGDFVPLDWLDTHRREVARRLAPNLVGGAATPDFRIGTYFADSLAAGDSAALAERFLRLRDPDERPILPLGDTPLGTSLFEFQEWYENGTATDGFADEAGLEVILPDGTITWELDQLWGCRKKALLVLTDGQEECWTGDNDCNPFTAPVGPDLDPDGCGYYHPCPIAAELFDPDNALGFTADQEEDRSIETYVVGFGVPASPGDTLACMAQNGRALADVDTTGNDEYLFLPENKDELSADLANIFLELQVEARAFAAAALPAAQSTAADNIYLSSLTPLPLSPFWPGRIDAFRRPLPLTGDGEPDLDRDCASNGLEAACHSWEAGKQLCEQAPSAAEFAMGDFKLGADAADERRILYSQASDGSRPNSLRLFTTPTLPMDPMPGDPNPALPFNAEDLVAALDPAELRRYEADFITPTELGDFFDDVIGETVRRKDNGLDPLDPEFPDDIGGCDDDMDGKNESFVLGDVFHATPVPILNPTNFTYFAQNMFGEYRGFARKHAWRRRMLVVPANDGQVHFFDIGIRQLELNTFTTDPFDTIELFNDGSGHELFSYIPRPILPLVRQQVDSDLHLFSLDGTVATGDVYIDPVHASGGATLADREWRTVVVGGLREGGDFFREDDSARNFKSAYYALDVTQPDILVTRTDPSDPTQVPCEAAGCTEATATADEWVPSCLSLAYPPGDGSQSAVAGECGGVPFPAELWTFDDRIEVVDSIFTTNPPDNMDGTDDELLFYLDEDENGLTDLGDTWSRAVIGQIYVCADSGTGCVVGGDESDLESVQVAIFGGGMDPRRKGETQVSGNYLYMIDVETGDLIYKRELPCPPDEPGCDVGSAAADPAVLDTNRDGYFDVIYIGTTEGKLYKVDITPDAPALVPERAMTSTVNTEQLVLLDSAGDATRFVDEYGIPGPSYDTVGLPRRVEDAAWDPFLIFDSGGSPIYHAPATFYIPELDQYGLAFGTGDREDLWDSTNGEDASTREGGRFFVIVDDNLVYDPDLYNATTTPDCDQQLPIVQACIKNFAIDVDLLAAELDTDYLLDPTDDTDFVTMVEPNPRRGWALILTETQTMPTPPKTARVTTEAFVVSGVLIFSAFNPEILNISSEACQQTGTTAAFVVDLTNSGPIAFLGPDNDGDPTTDPPPGRAVDRYHVIEELTTAPFVGSTAIKNPDVGGDTLLDKIQEDIGDAVREALVEQYPRGTRFNRAYSLLIAALRNSTGVDVYTTVPIGMYPADWKDQ